jgi:hypothetical protein
MTDYCTDMILKHAAAFKGRQVLEIGTSRGRLTAMLAALGCIVTTVDHIDRGAKTNLEGLSVTVIHDDAIRYLQSSSKWFDLVIVDFHGNSKKDWKRYAAQVKKKISQGCTLITNNIKLSNIAEWHEETGPDWFLKKLSGKYFIKLYDEWHPGVAVITKKSNGGSIAIPGLQYGREAWVLIRRRLTLTRDKAALEQSGLFDLQYYLENNSDIRDSGVDPLRHYLLHGGFEGRKPCDHFDSRFYLERYPDVTVCGMNPLLHYIRHGRQQERSANGKHL